MFLINGSQMHYLAHYGKQLKYRSSNLDYVHLRPLARHAVINLLIGVHGHSQMLQKSFHVSAIEVIFIL
jgi:hypothetical protein